MQRAVTTTSKTFQKAEALSVAEFNAAMADFAPLASGMAVAVSGGPDSMALAVCTKRWATERNMTFSALIVDHVLRANSTTEAEKTKEQLDKLGISAHILRWDHGPIVSRLHSTARKARYRLLIEACKNLGVRDLLLAHHRDDQAETILMRFAKGSGIDGLAGIAAETPMDKVRLLRPFLSFPKERLIATCTTANLSYVVDPSNASEKFARGRLRRIMPLLTDEGLTCERLCDLGARASEARDALNHYTNMFLEKSAQQDDAGVIRMDIEALRALPRAISGRAVSHALQTIHHEDYAPEQVSLAGLLDAVCNHNDMTSRTLHGCLVSMTATQLIVMREYAAITDALLIHPGETVSWDGRWHVTLAHDVPQANYTIRPLGNPPHDVLDKFSIGLRQKIPQGRARSSLPSLWVQEKDAENKGVGHLALIPSLTRSSSSSLAYAQVLALKPLDR